ncbi:MAG: homoserine dehydrogenase [Bacteroidales bacterium]|nr:homoserine dehydrogenase [Bacteroidales bacterium]
MHNNIHIGLFGFGVVGEGLFHVLENARNANAVIEKICVKNKDKKRSLADHFFTLDKNEILNDAKINLVVELIDDADEAYTIVKQALNNGKSVVSGNKKMLAYHLEELIQIQKEKNVALLYDASACGSIPVIRNLEEYYDNDLLQSVTGILNGSSNYILSKIFNEQQDYAVALKKAQELGFAESNPTFDVDGFDSLYKLIILTIHSFGLIINPDDVLNYGISNVSKEDVQFAKEKGFKIKLTAQVSRINNEQISLFVLPKFVSPNEYIYNVENEYNGVIIEGKFYEKQFMFGKGAGGFPTGSSVLSDITARSHNYKYEYKKQKINGSLSYTTDHLLEIYLRYQNVVDLSLFEFEEISEKHVSNKYNYVIGKITLKSILKLKHLLPKLNIFIVNTGN